MRRRSILIIPFILLLALIINACGSIGPTRSTATPYPTPDPKGTLIPELILTLTANRLDKPVVPANNPSQADKGSITYWLVCIPCHGDKGQGLTDEWRLVFGVEEMNCWQSKCHAANHPEEGFALPKTVPAIIGPRTLARYSTAAELHDVIATRMPWYNPKVITPEEAWNLTAHLMRANGVLPNGVALDAGNVAVFRLHTPLPSTIEERPVTIVAVGLLIATVIAIAFNRVWRS